MIPVSKIAQIQSDLFRVGTIARKYRGLKGFFIESVPHLCNSVEICIHNKWYFTIINRSGFKIRVLYWKLYFLSLNLNIWCGYSKETSQWDGSFEHPKHMFKLRDKKIETKGAQWLSGRVLDSRPRGPGFEPHRRHCFVSLSKTH